MKNCVRLKKKKKTQVLRVHLGKCGGQTAQLSKRCQRGWWRRCLHPQKKENLLTCLVEPSNTSLPRRCSMTIHSAATFAISFSSSSFSNLAPKNVNRFFFHEKSYIQSYPQKKSHGKARFAFVSVVF